MQQKYSIKWINITKEKSKIDRLLQEKALKEPGTSSIYRIVAKRCWEIEINQNKSWNRRVTIKIIQIR